MSSLFGGIGSALAGNWLYDQFSGRHHGGYTDQSSYGSDVPVDGGDNWSGGGDVSGDWGGGGDTGGGDWGGGGGDWGGGGGEPAEVGDFVVDQNTHSTAGAAR